jgi:hypothetical protein
MAVFRLTYYLWLLGLKLNNSKKSLMAGVLFGTYELAGLALGFGKFADQGSDIFSFQQENLVPSLLDLGK